MANLNKLMGFIPTRDFQRAREPYEHVLGLRFVSENPFALVFDSGGIMVRVTKVPDFQPHSSP
jgi:catechol 2,3-dioxygenase-like lactoylglutathione lyase family enzyme